MSAQNNNAVIQKKQPAEGLDEFKKNVKAFAKKTAAKTAQAQPAQAEPVEVEAEQPKTLYQPPQQEVTLATIKELYYIMTGDELTVVPELVMFPPNDYEDIRLVRSSCHNTYYRVTANSCTCLGWYHSVLKFGVGKCRHHTLAFKEEAAKNCQVIADIKLGRNQGGKVETSTSPSSLAMPEKIEAVKLALEQGGIPFKSIVQDVMGEGSILIKMPYCEDLTADQARKMERALTLGREAAGPRVYTSAC
jgi:hypothetical protein